MPNKHIPKPPKTHPWKKRKYKPSSEDMSQDQKSNASMKSLTYLRAEGAPVHPDDPLPFVGTDAEYTDWYNRYFDYYGRDREDSIYCSRPWLFKM